MSSEIIQSVVYDNYDNLFFFPILVNFIFPQIFITILTIV